MKKILTAFQFLTKLPITIKSFEAELLPESTIYFPFVGLTLGGALVGLEYVLSQILPPQIIAIILVAFLALITGGLHMDGFADTFDGLGCVKSREERLQVMKDSCIGTMGALAVIFLVLLKYNALYLIKSDVKNYALLVFPIVSRWAMVFIIFLSSQKGHIGLGNRFQKEIKEKHFILSSILPLLIMVYFFDSLGLIFLVGVSTIAFALYMVLLKVFGKITGDHFGFINEITEVVVLIIFLMV